MATPSPLKDIEDKYFECSYCLENFKEPKLLPCVHRFCRNCLKKVIGKLVNHFNCPLCNHVCAIPPEGVDGFRTDFHMKNMLQYIQLRQSAETEETKECAGCSKEAKITSYCLECKGFLCEQCYQIHMTLKMMKEHRPSVVSLKDLKEQKLTLERLSALTETPRCSAHVEKVAEICCGTCNNLPICMVCGHHGEHEGHKLHDVRLLAGKEREKIEKSLATLKKYSVNVQQLPIKVEEAKSKLNENISDRKEKLQIQYNNEAEKIRRQLQEIDDLLDRSKTEIDGVEKQEVTDLEKQREKEIVAAVKEINDKYDTLVKETKTKNQSLRDCQEDLYGEKKAKINRKLGFIDKAFKDLNKSIDMQEDQNSKDIEKISKDADNRMERLDNFRSSVSGILASKNDWTYTQCLPDINTASDPLIENVKRNYPELEFLTHIAVSDLPSFTADAVSITEQAESVIDIDGINDFEGLKIFNLTTTDNGRIIITGDIDDGHTHIAVINRKGEVMYQYRRKNVVTIGNDRSYHFRSCSDMSVFKVASTCRDDEVGIYNTQNNTYIRKDMGDITNSWVKGKIVTCVAVDRISTNIYVGSSSRDVFILDDELTYCRTLHLPEMISFSNDMCIHDGYLVVCDFQCKKVCIVTTVGPDAKLVSELPKPDHEGGDWSPFRVCTDTNGFIYVLWHGVISEQVRRILTQHSQDGRRLLRGIPVDRDAYALTTAITDNTEKLLLATTGTGKMYSYGLVMDYKCSI